MRQLAASLFGAVASPLRFAVITALLAFTTLPLLAQEQPIPAELSFLNKIGKPYRITYEPWTEMQIPEGNRGMGGVGKGVRGKHWQFPVIVTGAMTGDAVWAIIKPAFLANGWTAVNEWSAGGIEMLLHYQKDGVEAWAETDPSGVERASVDCRPELCRTFEVGSKKCAPATFQGNSLALGVHAQFWLSTYAF